MRVIVRRELPHPGATLDAFEIRDGYRYQAFTTHTDRGQLAFQEVGTVRTPASKTASGPGRTPASDTCPPGTTNINAVWVELALIAADLLALTQSMLLTDQPELHRAEPKTLRSRLLHIAARIPRGQRKVFQRLAGTVHLCRVADFPFSRVGCRLTGHAAERAPSARGVGRGDHSPRCRRTPPSAQQRPTA